MEPRHAVVVGASRGLGEAVARKLAKEGWRVSIGARSNDRLEEIAHELEQTGCEVWASPMDVSDAESVRDFFTAATRRFGPPNGVVHSAARYGPFASVQAVTADDWIRTIDINLIGTFHVLRRAAGAMNPDQPGSILVLSGGGATAPMPTVSAYAASKAAVVRLVETFAGELRDTQVTVNSIAPGLMATEMLEEIVSADPDALDPEIRSEMLAAKKSGEDSMPVAVEAITFLLDNPNKFLTGRLISAKWDPWQQWLEEPTLLQDPNAYTLRREVPEG